MSVIENPTVESDSDDGEGGAVDEEHQASASSDRAGLYLATLIALAVPSIIVLALFLPNGARSSTDPRVEPAPAGLDASVVADEVVVDEVPAEVAGATETTVDDTPTPITDGGLLDPGSIEVFVYDESPMVDGEFTFAIRLKSVSTPTEIDTNHFTVVVEDADGVPAVSATRFTHETLPIGSSALASVRASDTGATTNFVVVNMGETEIARVPVELR